MWPPQNDQPNEKEPTNKRFSAEQLILFAGLICFFIFLWMVAFLIFSVASDRSGSVVQRLLLIPATATPEFRLPATWTPTPPGYEPPPTPTGTGVYDGAAPTRIYTPRATSVPLSSLPFPIIPPRLTVVDLARIMQGESPGDLQAAYMVGWVAKNRLTHSGYGESYAVVSHGFFGYRADIQPRKDFLDLARRVIRARDDPTDGSLYALSRTDITKLNIPPERADVAYGEWFFFRTWPLSGR